MRPALPALLLGAVFIALSPIFVRLSEAGPTATAFWRVALAVPVLWIFFRPPLRGRSFFSSPRDCFRGRPRLLASVDPVHLGGELDPARQPRVDLRHLAAWVLWREKPRALFLVALGLALGGVALLVHTRLSFSGTALLGDALGVVTAMFYAWYILAVKGLRDRGAATLQVMAVTTTLTALILFPVALVTGEPMLPSSAYGWWILIGLALISHAAGQGSSPMRSRTCPRPSRRWDCCCSRWWPRASPGCCSRSQWSRCRLRVG